MSDVVDIGSAKPKREVPGRCSACHQDIDVERLFTQGGAPTARFHLDRVGNACGPVLTKFAYRVVAWIQPIDTFGRPRVFLITRRRPIESGSDEGTVASWIADQLTKPEANGAASPDPKPEVVVLFAQPIGVE